MRPLTNRQKETLDFIATFTKENGFPPTVREISDYFRISLRAVQDHIAACQKKGYLSQSNKKSRSLRIVKKDGEKEVHLLTQKIPLIDTITSSKLLICDENISGYTTVTDPFINPDKKYFALKVQGENMINAGILDGDIAIIEQTETAENGQIIAIIIDNSVTLKRFFREGGRIRLQSENSTLQPIYTTDAQIVGKMAGLIRTY